MGKLKEFNIKKIFKKDNYIIPLYQRNYAWEAPQVVQLIQDVWDYASFESHSNYYIGTLVVHKKKIDNITHYETIDGQQRLTTINILLSVLKNEFGVEVISGYEMRLKFHSRSLSSKTLKSLSENGTTNDNNLNSKMHQAYLDIKKILKELFKTKTIEKEKFVEYLFKKIIILRVEVPHDTDLNHYFEIMNNRGEQLEKHEILKATLLSYLKDSPQDSKTFATIWDACSNMERYIQYGFEKKTRDLIFTGENNDTIPENADIFFQTMYDENLTKTEGDENQIKAENDKNSFLDIAENEEIKISEESSPEDEKELKFNSIITFPNFLLHVLKISANENVRLDDKNLNKRFTDELNKITTEVEKAEFVKYFGYNLFKCKCLFDKYIIKREYKIIKDEWSLKRIKIGESQNYYYANTFEEPQNKQLIMLLSMFHVSFPQAIYKHWLNGALIYLFTHYKNGIDSNEYLKYLDLMSDAFYFDRLSEKELDYHDIIYKNSSKPVSSEVIESNLHQGTNVQNFIFNRLDYLLWKSIVIEEKGKFNIKDIEKFEFSFRSSVEHFFPQNPKQIADRGKVSDKLLHNFGNLCLISRSKNSELSNYDPIAKAQHYNASTAIESLKQQLMMAKCDDWYDEAIEIHQREMIKILNKIA